MNVKEISKQAWQHLVASAPADAALCFTRIPREKRDASDTMGLGLSLMASGQYERAEDYFCSLNAERADFSARYYEMAGGSEWCLGKFALAIDNWKEMMECAYGDGANHVSAALLLYYAAFRKPQFVTYADAVRCLKRRLSKSAARNWPGPLARFLIDESGEDEVEAIWKTDSVYIGSRIGIDFVVGLKNAVNGNQSVFHDKIAPWASHPIDDSIIYYPEYYLAKYEVAFSSSTADR